MSDLDVGAVDGDVEAGDEYGVVSESGEAFGRSFTAESEALHLWSSAMATKLLLEHLEREELLAYLRGDNRLSSALAWRNEKNSDKIDALRDSGDEKETKAKQEGAQAGRDLLNRNFGDALWHSGEALWDSVKGNADHAKANGEEYMPDVVPRARD